MLKEAWKTSTDAMSRRTEEAWIDLSVALHAFPRTAVAWGNGPRAPHRSSARRVPDGTPYAARPGNLDAPLRPRATVRTFEVQPSPTHCKCGRQRGPTRDALQKTILERIKVLFCRPRSPWQRVRNGKTNWLLTRFYPRGTACYDIVQAQLGETEESRSQRSTHFLDIRSPAEAHSLSAASSDGVHC